MGVGQHAQLFKILTTGQDPAHDMAATVQDMSLSLHCILCPYSLDSDGMDPCICSVLENPLYPLTLGPNFPNCTSKDREKAG